MALNPNIRKLLIPESFLSGEQSPSDHRILNSTFELDELAIKILGHSSELHFYRLLKELQERGAYKQLKVFVRSSELERHVVDKLAAFHSTIVKLTGYFHSRVELGQLSSLEEISVQIDDKIIDFTDLLSICTNLQLVEFEWASSDDLLPLIRQAAKLKKMKVIDLENGTHFSETSKIIDLIALNNERETLAYAQKITFYVKEDIYLATKFALGETNFNLIRLQRIESFECDYEFASTHDA